MSNQKEFELPKINKNLGTFHPINQMMEYIMNLLVDFGFEIVLGPEIESEEFNFNMLNIKESHPARQMHDTFYVNNKKKLLRTHTSPVQVEAWLKKPPLAFISGGKVFRKDDDSTHLPMFHQVEGIMSIRMLVFKSQRPYIQNCLLSFVRCSNKI